MSTYSEKSAEQNMQDVDQSPSMKGGCPFKAMQQLEKVMTSEDDGEVHDIKGIQCNISSILQQCPYLHKICEPINQEDQSPTAEFIQNYEHDEKIADSSPEVV